MLGFVQYLCMCVCVCVCVCMSVCYCYFATPGNKAEIERYQQPQCYYVNVNFENAIFLKLLSLEVTALNTNEKNKYGDEFEHIINGFHSLRDQ